MKLIPFLILILSMATNIALAQNLDYWGVYYNDSLIGQFNELDQNLSIEIQKEKVKAFDMISIKYVKADPCELCTFVCFIRDDKHQRVKIKEKYQAAEPIYYNLQNLLNFQAVNQSNYFEFYYYEESLDGPFGAMRYVFDLSFY